MQRCYSNRWIVGMQWCYAMSWLLCYDIKTWHIWQGPILHLLARNVNDLLDAPFPILRTTNIEVKLLTRTVTRTLLWNCYVTSNHTSWRIHYSLLYYWVIVTLIKWRLLLMDGSLDTTNLHHNLLSQFLRNCCHSMSPASGSFTLQTEVQSLEDFLL